MAISKVYKVEVSHPTGFHNGVKEITVYTYPETKWEQAHKTCSGQHFGYSRDYRVKTDLEAIKMFLSEHACSVKKCSLKK